MYVQTIDALKEMFLMAHLLNQKLISCPSSDHCHNATVMCVQTIDALKENFLVALRPDHKLRLSTQSSLL